MKSRAAITALTALILYPGPAFCAEQNAAPFSWLSFAYYVVNFAAFVFILVHFSASYVNGFFDTRASDIRRNLKDTQADFERAQELANKAAGRIAALEADKASIAREIQEETAREVARMLDVARATADRIRRDAELTAQAIEQAGHRQIRIELAARAAAAARSLIARSFDQSDQDRLIREFMDRLTSEVRP